MKGSFTIKLLFFIVIGSIISLFMCIPVALSTYPIMVTKWVEIQEMDPPILIPLAQETLSFWVAVFSATFVLHVVAYWANKSFRNRIFYQIQILSTLLLFVPLLYTAFTMLMALVQVGKGILTFYDGVITPVSLTVKFIGIALGPAVLLYYFERIKGMRWYRRRRIGGGGSAVFC